MEKARKFLRSHSPGYDQYLKDKAAKEKADEAAAPGKVLDDALKKSFDATIAAALPSPPRTDFSFARGSFTNARFFRFYF